MLPVGGLLFEKEVRDAEKTTERVGGFIARRSNGGRGSQSSSSADKNGRGWVDVHAQGWRCGARFYAEVFRWQRVEECFPERVPWEEKRRAGIFYLCFHRWLNGPDEVSPAGFETAGSCRHPGPGCEHG